MITVHKPPQEAVATVVVARAALEAARASERADVLAWVQEAERRLASAEEVSMPCIPCRLAHGWGLHISESGSQARAAKALCDFLKLVVAGLCCWQWRETGLPGFPSLRLSQFAARIQPRYAMAALALQAPEAQRGPCQASVEHLMAAVRKGSVR